VHFFSDTIRIINDGNIANETTNTKNTLTAGINTMRNTLLIVLKEEFALILRETLLSELPEKLSLLFPINNTLLIDSMQG
jgi:hypothetical protein